MLQVTDIRLHRATEADADGIAAVHVRSWQAAYRGLLPQAYLDGLSVTDRAASWRHELSALPADRRPWVALVEERVRGFVIAGPSRDEDGDPDTAEIHALYVDPECWDLGVGRALMHHQVDFLRRRGYRHATLWVLADNLRATGFYEAGRWARDGAVKSVVIAGQTLQEVRYRLELA
jgi:ribosomal protein S18 acetylase RimI-like enzyme